MRIKDKFKSISLKIFLIINLVLIIAAGLIYTAVYFFLPGFYLEFKKDSLDKELTFFVLEAKEMTLNEGEKVLQSFAVNHNNTIVIADKNNKIICMYGSSIPEAFKGFIKGNVNEKLFQPSLKSGNGDENRYSYLLKTLVIFRDGNYVVYFSTHLQPVEEISTVLYLFMPYIFLGSIILSFIVSFIYSKMITNPLIKLRDTAEKMAHLDFSVKSDIKSSDEIGQLGNSLNILSENLKTTMGELEQVNASLVDDIEKERAKEESRRKFIAIMSHELKSPITAVKGQLEGMILNIGAYKNRDHYLKRSYDLMTEMDELVKEILISSKLEKTDFIIEKSKINLSQLIKKSIEGCHYLEESKNLKTVVDIEEDIFLQGDNSLLKKAFNNIINNGYKYAYDNSEIIVHLYQVDRRIQFSIFNEADPLNEKDLVNDKIFGAFYRGEKSRNRKTGGSGIGLYIVKKILDLHGFEYSIKNVKNGIMFRVTIYLDSNKN